jgi:hypothetical protein
MHAPALCAGATGKKAKLVAADNAEYGVLEPVCLELFGTASDGR